MKFLVPNYSCLQNHWPGGYRPQIPILSVLCPQLNLLNPPPEQNSWVRHCVGACNPIALYRTAQILKSHFATSSNYNESSSHSCWHKQLCIIFIYRVTALFAEGVNITPPSLKNRVWWTCHAYAAKSSNNSTTLTANRYPSAHSPPPISSEHQSGTSA